MARKTRRPLRGKRLSICYAVPGHNLLSSAGPTRNVLYLAEAMSEKANVTVAFPHVLEPLAGSPYKIVEIGPAGGRSLDLTDDSALRAMSFSTFVAYLAALRRFVVEQTQSFDVVLEKSWLLSGYLTALRRRRGLPAAVIENIVRVWSEPVSTPRAMLRYGRYMLTQMFVGRQLRYAPLIIAETEELKIALMQRWGISRHQIEVVGLGVNHDLFRPLDQSAARQRLGISPGATVLLYAGVLDATHNLLPALEAMEQAPISGLELHIIGDGELRDVYEARARSSRVNVTFHGRIAHAKIPEHIAAADLCLAPYDPSAFPNGQVAYSTLKIPEYMACGRPVVSVPSGHILSLLKHRVSGFLFDNEPGYWIDFLHSCPTREELRRMGFVAQDAAASCRWEETADAYLSLCEHAVQNPERNGIVYPT